MNGALSGNATLPYFFPAFVSFKGRSLFFSEFFDIQESEQEVIKVASNGRKVEKHGGVAIHFKRKGHSDTIRNLKNGSPKIITIIVMKMDVQFCFASE